MTDAPRPRQSDWRRQDDRRINALADQVGVIDRRTQEIRDMLISEPEQSPMGRALVRKSEVNARRLDEHDVRIDTLWDFMIQWRGAGRVVTVAAAVLSVLAGAIALASWFRPPQV